MPRKKSILSSNWFTLMVLLIAPAIILLAAWFYVGYLNQGKTGQLYRTLDAEVAWTGEHLQASLHFFGGETLDSVYHVKGRAADVLVCLDRSYSMGFPEGPASPLAKGISATVRLCGMLGGAGARVGLMTFDDVAEQVAPLTEEPEQIRDAAQDVKVRGGTDIAVALLAALDLFAADNTTTDRDKYLVVISDFCAPNPGAGQAAIRRLASASVQTIGIGVGSEICDEYLNEVFEVSIMAANVSDLDSIFNKVVMESQILPVYAERFDLQERIDVRDFEVWQPKEEIPYLMMDSDLPTGRLSFWIPALFEATNT
ncbi:MAG: VWA domain-containing protein, partial [candidate division Zixibacteria bacterium]|nr:VWA domain-containing protein [candidate division Zixibacteria bacterium]